jgi:ferredoxin--NADP+ reductase
MPKWCPATVIARKIWTDGLFTLTIASDLVLPFEPGQFLHLALGDDANRVNRPYSVASPHGPELDFFIVLVGEGGLTPKLWQLSPGDSVDVSERAAGSFTLGKTPDAETLWLVSTGTGLAPYIAMLRTSQPWDRFAKIIVVHGVRQQTDLAYTDELRKFETDSKGRFKLLQTLTRDKVDHLLHGRIPDLLESGALENAAGTPLNRDNSVVMLCGNPAMLDEMELKLDQRQMTKHRTRSPGQIVLERYW